MGHFPQLDSIIVSSFLTTYHPKETDQNTSQIDSKVVYSIVNTRVFFHEDSFREDHPVFRYFLTD